MAAYPSRKGESWPYPVMVFVGSSFNRQSVDYEYVICAESPNFSSLEGSKYPELFEEVKGMSDDDEILRQTDAARERVRQDILVLVEHTDPPPTSE